MKVAWQIVCVALLISINIMIGIIWYEQSKDNYSLNSTHDLVENRAENYTGQASNNTPTPNVDNLNKENTTEQLEWTLSGKIVFSMSYIQSHGEVLGYTFYNLKEREGYSASVYGAPDAQIEIHDALGKIIGLVTTDSEGTFHLEAPKDDYYKLEILYDGVLTKVTLNNAQTSDITIYLGHYSTFDGTWQRE